jgi:hypothetical protein
MMRVYGSWQSPKPWLAVLNAFSTLSCILLKLKRRWEHLEQFEMAPVTVRVCKLSSTLILVSDWSFGLDFIFDFYHMPFRSKVLKNLRILVHNFLFG